MTDAATVEATLARFLEEHPVASTPDRELREARFDAGLAFVSHEPGFGGLAADPALQPIVDEAFAQAGAADWSGRNVIGLGMAAPTIHAHGTTEQKQRLLRPLFSGEEIWCQLFSEPGAGSDLAALSTRATRTDDSWSVSGQKVWTTLAHVARWGLLLARTDPDAPKHRGLTYFILDMHAPGVEVRPLRQITGEAEFNEVFFDDVAVPDAGRLGPVGAGWNVAMTTLMNERLSLGGRIVARGEGPIAALVATWQQGAEQGAVEPADLDRVMALWARSEAARLTNVRANDTAGRGTPGPEASIAKLQMAELNQAIYDLSVELAGPDGLGFPSYAETRPTAAAVHGGSGDIRYDYLRSRANSIEGGTSEVLRNILGERVLGLPPEPRVDKNLPWNKVPRS
jgi:alkylation response protein AidB-like acyl-CoA dehydrogenase